MLHERGKGINLLAHTYIFVFFYWQVVLARLIAHQEVHLAPDMLVMGIDVFVVVPAVISLFTSLLTIVPIENVS